MKHGGLKVISDTGAPSGAGFDSYTTLVLLHGFSFHSGIFSRLLPFAPQNRCRIVLVNRRGYPGATPYEEEEMGGLKAAQEDTAEGREALATFLIAGARGIYNFLEQFILEENIPVSGGVILTGWSMCGAWLNALLATASSFPVSDINVARYIRRVVTYDTPYHALGFNPLEGAYNPLRDENVPIADRPLRFGLWVSGYFAHPGDGPLEQHTPLVSPVPTLLSMTPGEIAANAAPEPTGPGGSDALVYSALPLGAPIALRRAALFPQTGDSWGEVEWRHIWCDRSSWEMPYGAAALRDELARVEKPEKPTRKIMFVRWRGANHFAHWDRPEQSLKAFLADESEDVQIY